MQHFGKAALRVTKNYTKGYSDTQAKVRDATSNDPWGPSGTQMNEIAQLTYNQNDFIEIMEMLDKRLNDKGKNWRHVFKSLTVLDYCLHQGSENVVIYFRDNIYVIKTLKEFQYIDEEGKDQGANVRLKAKDITNLLMDESRLKEERKTRAHMRDRMLRGASSEDNDEDENIRRRQDTNGLSGPSGKKKPKRDDDELTKAIEESRKSLAREQKDREEKELEEALRLSKEEEEKRKKDVENSNASALFDDANQLPSPSTVSSSTSHFPLVDPTPYAAGLQPQFTIQPQFTSVMPQFTSFNPYQQQAEQEAAQAEFLRQQQMFILQQQQAQQQHQQQQQQQQQQEEWLRQQQQLQMQQNLFVPQPSVHPQPTGFGQNNPFAPSASPSAFSSSPEPFVPHRGSPAFNLQGTYDNHLTSNLPTLSSSPKPLTPQQQPQQQQLDSSRPVNARVRKDENETLAALFADREGGQDTFGNVGPLRYGYTDAGRHVQQHSLKTHNPFSLPQQQQQGSSNNERPFFDI